MGPDRVSFSFPSETPERQPTKIMNKPEATPATEKSTKQHLRQSLRNRSPKTRPAGKTKTKGKIGTRSVTTIDDLIALRESSKSLAQLARDVGAASRQAVASTISRNAEAFLRAATPDEYVLTPRQQNIANNLASQHCPLVAICRLAVASVPEAKRIDLAIILSFFLQIPLDSIVTQRQPE